MKLEARDISFRYGEGERQVLAHVDLTVESGERVGIMAPSGFGKTTLLKILAGYERPESGEVLLDGTPLERFRGYVPVQMIWQHPEDVYKRQGCRRHGPRLKNTQISGTRKVQGTEAP